MPSPPTLINPNQIGPGTFSSGTFIFPGNLTASGTVLYNNKYMAGPGATPTIDTQVNACVAAGGGIVEISPLYTGIESVNLTNNAVDGSNYVIYRGNPICTVIDFRANSGIGKGYGINYSSGNQTLQSQNRMAITYPITSPTITVSGLLVTTQITGTLPSGQGMAGITSEVDGEGNLAGTLNQIWQPLAGQWAMRATNSPTILGTVEGVSGGGGMDRAASTGTISQGMGMHAYALTNVSTSGGTISNAYGVFSELQTVGTARNYSFYGKGNTGFVEGMGIDIDNPGVTGPFPLMRFGQLNNIGTAGVNIYPAGNFTSPVMKFCNQNAAKENWMLGSQINIDHGFEINPAASVGVCGSGNTYGTSLFALSNASGTSALTIKALQNPMDAIAAIPGSDTNEAFIAWNAAKTTQGWSVTGTGQHSLHETSAPAGSANNDQFWGDSTAHRLKMNNNNGGAVTVPALEVSDTWTGTESFAGNTVALTADWTCGTGGTVSSCVAATIIGSGGGVPLTFTLPLFARSYTLECDGVVAQATGDTANNWNLLTATNGATNTTAYYSFSANGATAPTIVSSATTDQASTTTTFNIGGTWTLGALIGAAKYPFHIWAKIEGASASGTVLSLQIVAPTVGDLVTIYRGTACRIF